MEYLKEIQKETEKQFWTHYKLKNQEMCNLINWKLKFIDLLIKQSNK